MTPPEHIHTETSVAPWGLKSPIAPALVDRVVSSLVKKGSLFPFNKIGPMDGGTGDKLTSPYANSVWVMRAIKKVAGPISAVPLKFTLDARGGEQEFEDPDLRRFWNSPARGLTGSDFIEATVGWLKLKGEAFWLLDDSWLLPFPNLKQLGKIILARTDRLQEQVSGGELMGWRFTDGAGRQHLLLPQQVVQPKFWNPYNEWRGLAEYEAAQIAAEADYLAGKFNLNLMRNNGDRGPYIIAKGGPPDDTQRTQIIQQLREKKQLALSGQFRPVFLTGDITVEDPKVQSLDAAVLASRLQNRHEVFIAFGVPPSMADVVASYSIGSASDRYILIEETCMPTADKIADGIEVIARKLSGKDLFAWFDWDEHSVMQQVRRERIDSAVKLWAMGQPMEEINDYLRLGMKPFDGWDQGYIPFGLAPVGSEELTQPKADAQFQEPTEDAAKAIAEARRAIRAKQLGMVRAPEADDFQDSRPKREISQWQTLMAKRKPVIKAYESAFNRQLMKARAETLRKLEQFQVGRATPCAPQTGSQGTASPTTRAIATDFIFDLQTFSDGLLAAFRRTSAGALQVAGNQLLEEIGKTDDPFTMPPEEVLNFHRRRENKLKDVPDDIFQQIKDTLEEGLELGESIDELSDRVRAEFNDISDERARTIAMTETAAAYGEGRDAAMKQAGVQFKKWLTSGNPNVRPGHAAANQQTVAIDEPFQVRNSEGIIEELMMPGDPNGSPSNVINCHCVSIAVAPPKEES